jgi:hypothetical protein
MEQNQEKNKKGNFFLNLPCLRSEQNQERIFILQI